MKKIITGFLLLFISTTIFAQTPIYECNQSVFYRTQIRVLEIFPDRTEKTINLLETKLDQQNLQINIYQSDRIEIVTKY
jgi:hypothetical protein